MYAYLDERVKHHTKAQDIDSLTYRLKYSTILSIQPIKHAAQQARHASTATICRHYYVFSTGRHITCSRCPSAFALFLAALRIILRSSKRVTINEPNAIEPRESVEARLKAERVGCFGYANKDQRLKIIDEQNMPFLPVHEDRSSTNLDMVYN